MIGRSRRFVTNGPRGVVGRVLGHIGDCNDVGRCDFGRRILGHIGRVNDCVGRRIGDCDGVARVTPEAHARAPDAEGSALLRSL